MSAKRYSTPSITVDVDVDLDQFELEDLADYLRHNGYQVSKDASLPAGDLDHIYTLAVAGQMEFAKQEALKLVGESIGRQLQ